MDRQKFIEEKIIQDKIRELEEETEVGYNDRSDSEDWLPEHEHWD